MNALISIIHVTLWHASRTKAGSVLVSLCTEKGQFDFLFFRLYRRRSHSFQFVRLSYLAWPHLGSKTLLRILPSTFNHSCGDDKSTPHSSCGRADSHRSGFLLQLILSTRFLEQDRASMDRRFGAWQRLWVCSIILCR